MREQIRTRMAFIPGGRTQEVLADALNPVFRAQLLREQMPIMFLSRFSYPRNRNVEDPGFDQFKAEINGRTFPMTSLTCEQAFRPGLSGTPEIGINVDAGIDVGSDARIASGVEMFGYAGRRCLIMGSIALSPLMLKDEITLGENADEYVDSLNSWITSTDEPEEVTVRFVSEGLTD